MIGSVFSSVYTSRLNGGSIFSLLPQQAQDASGDSVGAAAVVARQLDGPAASAYLSDVSEAFLSGLSVACLVVAGVAAAGSVFALRVLPARAESAT